MSAQKVMKKEDSEATEQAVDQVKEMSPFLQELITIGSFLK